MGTGKETGIGRWPGPGMLRVNAAFDRLVADRFQAPRGVIK